MSEPFLAEVRILPYNFAPLNWAFCDGGLMAITQNTALFSLIGTYFGGDGVRTFGLPNIMASCVVGAGNAPGLQPYVLGDTGGENTVALTSMQGAAHNHAFKCVNPAAGDANTNKPAPTTSLATSVGPSAYATTVATAATLNTKSLGDSTVPTGVPTPAPHENRMPFLGVSYCIALQGIFPQRP